MINSSAVFLFSSDFNDEIEWTLKYMKIESHTNSARSLFVNLLTEFVSGVLHC